MGLLSAAVVRLLGGGGLSDTKLESRPVWGPAPRGMRGLVPKHLRAAVEGQEPRHPMLFLLFSSATSDFTRATESGNGGVVLPTPRRRKGGGRRQPPE